MSAQRSEVWEPVEVPFGPRLAAVPASCPGAIDGAGMAQRRSVDPWHLPAAPLLEQIRLRGGDYACGVRIGTAEKRALERARFSGLLTVYMADKLAVRFLGLVPGEIWGYDV